jgi:GT2 family glycosyltransferase
MRSGALLQPTEPLAKKLPLFDPKSMISDTATVTAVIVTYQSRSTIAYALDSLKSAYDAGFAKCVVVDNQSADGTADYVADTYPWVEVVRSPENIGFGRGCNLGFERVTTPYVLFLNPDASLDLDALRTMTAFMDAHPSAAISGPATESPNGSWVWAGKVLTPLGLVKSSIYGGSRALEHHAIAPGSAPFKTEWVCGAIMLVRADKFRSLKGFDPRFFLYYEETDLCLRALRAGWDNWAIGEAIGKHVGRVSSKQAGSELSVGKNGDIAEYFYPSQFYYLAKNFGWLSAVLAESATEVLDWIRWLRRTRFGTAAHEPRKPRPFLKLPAKLG